MGIVNKVYRDNILPNNTSRGHTVGFMLTKNRQYLGIILPEYKIHMVDRDRCNEGIYNVLGRHVQEYRIKYSNNDLRKFYVGSVELVVDEKNYINTIIFDAKTQKNRSGWNFSAGENDYHTEIDIERYDELWIWKYGFAVVEHPRCMIGEINQFHQFILIQDAPYGLGPTNEPSWDYLGKNRRRRIPS